MELGLSAGGVLEFDFNLLWLIDFTIVKLQFFQKHELNLVLSFVAFEVNDWFLLLGIRSLDCLRLSQIARSLSL